MNPYMISSSVLLAIVGMLLILSIPLEQQAYALKNFFNCMTRIANSHHQLTIDDVNTCYAKEFKNPPHD